MSQTKAELVNGLSINNAADDSIHIANTGRAVFGSLTPKPVGEATGGLIQVQGTDASSAITIVRNAASNVGPRLAFGKSRSSAVNGNTIVQNNDVIGKISFSGADGTDLLSDAAFIQANVDGTPGSDDMPGRLVFATTADGATDPTAKMIIKSDGKIGIGTTTPTELLHLKSTTVDVDLLVEATGTNKDARVRLNGHSGGLSQIQFGDQDSGNIGLLTYEHSTNSMQFRTNGAERLRIQNAGRIHIGTSTNRGVGGVTPQVQLEGNNSSTSSISLTRSSNDNNSAFLMFGKTRSGTIGGNTIIQENDVIGVIRFCANDGNDTGSFVAQIKAEVDGAPGSNDTPGRLIFSTTADGAASATERLRIENDGTVRIFQNLSIADKIVHTGDTDTAIRFPAANVFSVDTAGSERFRIFSGGQAMLGSDTSVVPAATATFSLIGSYGGAAITPFFYMCRNEAATSITQNESLGQISFASKDGKRGSTIASASSGAWSDTSCPGRLQFFTTPASATVPVERIRVTSDGKVGIGESSPAYKLVVNSGTVDTVANFVSDDSIARIRIKDGDGANGIHISAVNDAMVFSANGQAEDVRITTAGDLGVGTNSPIAKLHAAGTAATVACLQRTSSGANVVLRFQNDNSSMFCGLTTNATGFAIDDDNDLGNGPMLFVSRSNGRIGIGEATPQAHLHIRGTSNVGIRLDDSSQSYGNIIYNNGQNSTDALTIAADEGDTQASTTMRFRIDASEKMRIDSDGQLSLGLTSTHGSKVHIHGTNTELIRLSAPGDASNVNQFGIGFVFSAAHTHPSAKIEIEEVDASDNRGNLVFSTRGSNTDSAPDERFHIKADGRIAVGSNATPNSNAAITSNYLQASAGTGMIGIVSNQTSHPNDTNNVAALARSINGATTRQCYIATRKVGTNNAAGFLYIQQRDGGNSHIWADNSAKIRTSNDSGQVGSTSGTVVGTQTSDIRLKNNLGSVSYGLTEINKITPIKFTFKKDESNRQQIGFSAQDLQSIIPESVYNTEETVEVEGTENKNILAMEYVSLIPVLVNAVKELSAKVAVLEAS